MPVGSWIYEKTNTSGGGGTVDAPTAPPVTITGSDVKEKENGIFEVQVFWQASALATPDNFLGTHVYLEDPDISNLELAPLNATVKLDGTSQSSGAWKPVHENESFASPATLKIPGKSKGRPIRIYILAYGKVTNAKLVRANRTGATPSIRIDLPAAIGQYVSGQENAWLVTDPSVVFVDDFDALGGPLYHLDFTYTPPDPSIPLPPGLRPFGGVMTVYEYDDGRRTQAMFLDVNHPEDWHSPDYDARGPGHYKIWFCSRDVDGNLNTIVPGVTPMVELTFQYPPAGQASAPDVTGLTLTNSHHEYQPDGTIYIMADLNWTNPQSPRYAGVTFYRMGVNPPRQLAIAPLPNSHVQLQLIDWPKTPEVWTIAAISFDFDGKPSVTDLTKPLPARVPTVTWTIGPPGPGGTGQEYAPLAGISGTTITTEQQLNSDGVVMMRHLIKNWQNPTDNKFGGMSIARVYQGDLTNATFWDAAKSATSLTTDWEPAPSARSWDFYFVSRDMQGRRNSILAGGGSGGTPFLHVDFVPMAGNIIPSRLPAGWWDPSEFQWPDYPAGQFQALNFVAKKIFVGSILRVGGGPSGSGGQFGGFENGQIAVYNSSNVIRAWAGEHVSATPDLGPHTIYGGWFSELYVGGDGPDTAPIYAKQDGTVIVGGWDSKFGRYPNISIRNEFGVEVGRLGAKVGEGLVAASDPAYIAGGWLKEFAVGGQSLADWRLLARRNASNPSGGDLVNLRNINNFTIDYLQNYYSPSNPTNAAMRLVFGYDAFVADVGNASYWKFPGISLVRSGTTQGITIVNRGIILTGPSGNRLVTLNTFNGDQFGSDIPSWFWGVLNLFSPNNGQVNVFLSSGNTTHGHSFFEMRDQIGTVNFQVNEGGDVTARRALTCQTFQAYGSASVASLFSTGTIQSNGLIQGQTVTAAGTSNAGNFNTAGNVQCASVSATGGITCQTMQSFGQTTAATLFSNGALTVNGGATVGSLNTNGTIGCHKLAIDGVDVISEFRQFVGAGVNVGGNQIFAAQYCINTSVTGASGSFTTANGKTVTVNGGIITSIV
jgi:hypothetical protein